MIPGLLLAAGTSSRMGKAKQLLDWRGQPLVRHVAQQALASALDSMIVVVGHEADTVRAALAAMAQQLAGLVGVADRFEFDDLDIEFRSRGR